jgi:hypothetical protein
MRLISFIRVMILAVAVLTAAAGLGCSEDCDKSRDNCLAQIKSNLADYSYDVTCRYPSMNSGDPKIFCQCMDEYEECKSK